MKKILLLGAGRSATTLIQFLETHAREEAWQVTVADADEAALHRKLEGMRSVVGKAFRVELSSERAALVAAHDLVISMLPWTLHNLVAKDCLRLGKHLVTASYVSPDFRKMAAKAAKKGVLFLGEMGLDPGIDHMSALLLLDTIRKEGGEVTGFHSYAGGLVAPACDDNPWHYKITWNPRNVVLAGQGVAQFLEEGRPVFRPYNQLFARATPVAVGDNPRYEVYPNRDSLQYIDRYGLRGVSSIMRGTLRVRGFSRAWDALIRLGLTDSSSPLDTAGLRWADFLSALLPEGAGSVESRCAQFLGVSPQDPVMAPLSWLGIFSDMPLGPTGSSAADHLQRLIEEKWKLGPEDRDLVVMEHRIRFRSQGETLECRSSLEFEGRDTRFTAMSDLVGLPLALLVRRFLRGEITIPDEPIPFSPNIYLPVMRDLESFGVRFQERTLTSDAWRSIDEQHQHP